MRKIANGQRAVILCFLAAFLIQVGLAMASGEPAQALLLVLLLGVSIVAAVFIFLLALKVYRSWVGVLMAILTLVPLVNLLVLLSVNARATKMLREHGIAVGFLGARWQE